MAINCNWEPIHHLKNFKCKSHQQGTRMNYCVICKHSVLLYRCYTKCYYTDKRQSVYLYNIFFSLLGIFNTYATRNRQQGINIFLK